MLTILIYFNMLVPNCLTMSKKRRTILCMSRWHVPGFVDAKSTLETLPKILCSIFLDSLQKQVLKKSTASPTFARWRKILRCMACTFSTHTTNIQHTYLSNSAPCWYVSMMETFSDRDSRKRDHKNSSSESGINQIDTTNPSNCITNKRRTYVNSEVKQNVCHCV